MDWVMDRLEGLDVTELIFITGHLKEQVEAFARSRYNIPSRFIEQKVQDGTAGAVNLARPYVKGPVLIIFVDTVFEADLTLINRTDADGIIWAKEVEDYQRFGVVVTDAKGYMTRIVEKPSTPISKLANIGLYYISAVDNLWKGIDHVLANPANKGEWYLTDAFQWMIEHGNRILTAEVGGWYDCGKLDTLLETNEILLRKGAARRVEYPGVTIHDPVYIEDGVSIEASEIGPNVSLEQGSKVTRSRLKNTIVGRNAKLNGVVLDGSLLGNGVMVDGLQGSVTVGDDSEVSAKRSGSL
jgi:glucose-1-phosphate thymidylyltransferase